MRPRVAIVLFNLGGPDRPEAIRPFLLNLFSDPAILRVPFFVRPFLARRIAAARLEPARANYAMLGGSSPLLDLTQAQARRWRRRCRSSMRGASSPCATGIRSATRPRRRCSDWQPDAVVLLPLYPQYSTTTTGSSLTAWREAAARVGLVADTTVLCCYPTDAGLHRRHRRAAARRPGMRRARSSTRLRACACCSPRTACRKPIVQGGRSLPVAGRADRRAACWRPGARRSDSVICYQSRATPQRWIGPSTEAEIERAAHDGVAVLVVPIAFVSEHSETLVELDIDYRALAERLGVPGYFRVPAQNADPAFIAALADLVRRARAAGPGLCSHAGGRICPRRPQPVSAAHGGMTIGFLAWLYPWTKAFHVIAMIAWMAGMFYLPRLFVYHCELRPARPRASASR